MTQRAEFSKKTKIAAWQRCGGHCELCGSKIITGNGPEHHHIIEDAIDGGNGLANCQVLCKKPCHSTITATHAPELARTRRIYEKRIGARKKSGAKLQSRGFQGHRKFDGSPVFKDRR